MPQSNIQRQWQGRERMWKIIRFAFGFSLFPVFIIILPMLLAEWLLAGWYDFPVILAIGFLIIVSIVIGLDVCKAD